MILVVLRWRGLARLPHGASTGWFGMVLCTTIETFPGGSVLFGVPAARALSTLVAAFWGQEELAVLPNLACSLGVMGLLEGLAAVPLALTLPARLALRLTLALSTTILLLSLLLTAGRAWLRMSFWGRLELLSRLSRLL